MYFERYISALDKLEKYINSHSDLFKIIKNYSDLIQAQIENKLAIILGNEGGKIKALSDLSVVVPSKNTARIQEAHTLISHTLCDLVEQSLVPTS